MAPGNQKNVKKKPNNKYKKKSTTSGNEENTPPAPKVATTTGGDVIQTQKTAEACAQPEVLHDSPATLDKQPTENHQDTALPVQIRDSEAVANKENQPDRKKKNKRKNKNVKDHKKQDENGREHEKQEEQHRQRTNSSKDGAHSPSPTRGRGDHSSTSQGNDAADESAKTQGNPPIPPQVAQNEHQQKTWRNGSDRRNDWQNRNNNNMRSGDHQERKRFDRQDHQQEYRNSNRSGYDRDWRSRDKHQNPDRARGYAYVERERRYKPYDAEKLWKEEQSRDATPSTEAPVVPPRKERYGSYGKPPAHLMTTATSSANSSIDLESGESDSELPGKKRLIRPPPSALPEHLISLERVDPRVDEQRRLIHAIIKIVDPQKRKLNLEDDQVLTRDRFYQCARETAKMVIEFCKLSEVEWKEEKMDKEKLEKMIEILCLHLRNLMVRLAAESGYLIDEIINYNGSLLSLKEVPKYSKLEGQALQDMLCVELDVFLSIIEDVMDVPLFASKDPQNTMKCLTERVAELKKELLDKQNVEEMIQKGVMKPLAEDTIARIELGYSVNDEEVSELLDAQNTFVGLADQYPHLIKTSDHLRRILLLMAKLELCKDLRPRALAKKMINNLTFYLPEDELSPLLHEFISLSVNDSSLKDWSAVERNLLKDISQMTRAILAHYLLQSPEKANETAVLILMNDSIKPTRKEQILEGICQLPASFLALLKSTSTDENERKNSFYHTINSMITLTEAEKFKSEGWNTIKLMLKSSLISISGLLHCVLLKALASEKPTRAKAAAAFVIQALIAEQEEMFAELLLAEDSTFSVEDLVHLALSQYTEPTGLRKMTPKYIFVDTILSYLRELMKKNPQFRTSRDKYERLIKPLPLSWSHYIYFQYKYGSQLFYTYKGIVIFPWRDSTIPHPLTDKPKKADAKNAPAPIERLPYECILELSRIPLYWPDSIDFGPVRHCIKGFMRRVAKQDISRALLCVLMWNQEDYKTLLAYNSGNPFELLQSIYDDHLGKDNKDNKPCCSFTWLVQTALDWPECPREAKRYLLEIVGSRNGTSLRPLLDKLADEVFPSRRAVSKEKHMHGLPKQEGRKIVASSIDETNSSAEVVPGVYTDDDIAARYEQISMDSDSTQPSDDEETNEQDGVTVTEKKNATEEVTNEDTVTLAEKEVVDRAQGDKEAGEEAATSDEVVVEMPSTLLELEKSRTEIHDSVAENSTPEEETLHHDVAEDAEKKQLETDAEAAARYSEAMKEIEIDVEDKKSTEESDASIDMSDCGDSVKALEAESAEEHVKTADLNAKKNTEQIKSPKKKMSKQQSQRLRKAVKETSV